MGRLEKPNRLINSIVEDEPQTSEKEVHPHYLYLPHRIILPIWGQLATRNHSTRTRSLQQHIFLYMQWVPDFETALILLLCDALLTHVALIIPILHHFIFCRLHL